MFKSYQSRSLVLCFILVAALSALSMRLIQIQLVDREHYAEKSNQTFKRVDVLPALRGMIVDRNEEPLAKSVPVADLFVDKNHLMDPKLAGFALAYERLCDDQEWRRLSKEMQRKQMYSMRGEILSTMEEKKIIEKNFQRAVTLVAQHLQLKPAELALKIKDSKSVWLCLEKDIPEDRAEELRQILQLNWIQGFQLIRNNKRWYTAPNMAVHLLGFTGETEVQDEQGITHHVMKGKFGIESTMDAWLTGKDGKREYRRNGRGLFIPGDVGAFQAPIPGAHVQLTIDNGIQTIIEEELDAGLREYQAHQGAVVVMNPKTGEILAMASRPHFDLNLKKNLSENSFNYAIQAIYEPGSTFKIIAASGALNEKLVSPKTTFFCHNGKYQNGAIIVPDHDPYANLTVEGILEKSSNVGTYKLALKLGDERFYDYAARYGFGATTGIQLSGESSGLIKNTNNSVDFSRASYGYAVNVTPLQLVRAYSVIANGGLLMQPRLVNSLIYDDGRSDTFKTQEPKRVLSETTAQEMRSALLKVTQSGGTAKQAAVNGFTVAGKTGTALKFNPKGKGYLTNSYIVSFVGMMPVENPAFVAIVVIDDPKTNQVKRYGGTIAAPIFSKIASRIAARMNLLPNLPITTSIANKK